MCTSRKPVFSEAGLRGAANLMVTNFLEEVTLSAQEIEQLEQLLQEKKAQGAHKDPGTQE